MQLERSSPDSRLKPIKKLVYKTPQKMYDTSMPFDTDPDTGLPLVPGHYFNVVSDQPATWYPVRYDLQLVKGQPRSAWLRVFQHVEDSVTIHDVFGYRDNITLTPEDIVRAAKTLAARFEKLHGQEENNKKYLGAYPPKTVN